MNKLDTYEEKKSCLHEVSLSVRRQLTNKKMLKVNAEEKKIKARKEI